MSAPTPLTAEELDTLRSLAEKAKAAHKDNDTLELSAALDAFDYVATPNTVLALLSELTALRARVVDLECKDQSLVAALRGEQGMVFDDGYEVNVADLRARELPKGCVAVCPQCNRRYDSLKPGGCGMFKGPIPCPLNPSPSTPAQQEVERM